MVCSTHSLVSICTPVVRHIHFCFYGVYHCMIYTVKTEVYMAHYWCSNDLVHVNE